MITLILLIIIYLAFISLGLPDAITGVSWPVMRIEFGMDLDRIGLVSIITTVATIFSSLLSGYLIDKLGTGKVVLFSVLMTALAILGISFIPSFWWMLLLAFPLGFGAGSIDIALSNYVAIHYKAHHVHWLNSFWGIGATLGPVIMSLVIISRGWRFGYSTIGLIQLGLFVVLLTALPLWNKVNHVKTVDEHIETIKPNKILSVRGVKTAVLIFIIYCALEFSVGLWGSSYLVSNKGLNVDIAARVIAIYYGGITIGRFISGFISFKLSNKHLIYLGMIIVFVGALLLNFNLKGIYTLIPFGIIGLGLAPIFPSMIHETPIMFGKQNSQYVMGYEMAGAYMGASILPPIFGFVAKQWDIKIFPYYILLLGILLLILVNTLFLRIKPEK